MLLRCILCLQEEREGYARAALKSGGEMLVALSHLCRFGCAEVTQFLKELNLRLKFSPPFIPSPSKMEMFYLPDLSIDYKKVSAPYACSLLSAFSAH